LQTPTFDLGMIYAHSHQVPARGDWNGPYRWDTWVIDWFAYPGSVGDIVVDGRSSGIFPRASHTWHVYAPQVAYRHRCDSGDARMHELLFFYFDLTSEWNPLSGRPLSVLHDPEERLCHHVRHMFKLSERGEPGSELIIRGHALAVFGEILAASLRGHAGTPEDPWTVQGPENTRAPGSELLLLVDEEAVRQLSRPPTLDEIAERLRMSTSSLAHRFKEQTGMSVMERVRWLRMREARRLLIQPGATVKSVARQLGFSSPFHFSRMFSDVTGMTAADFLRQRSR
jgi:AraC-like DNA-binding protein